MDDDILELGCIIARTQEKDHPQEDGLAQDPPARFTPIRGGVIARRIPEAVAPEFLGTAQVVPLAAIPFPPQPHLYCPRDAVAEPEIGPFLA